MKKSALAVIALAAGLSGLLSSCDEKGPVIDLGQGVVSSDTTFMAPAETAEARRVLIEEFTGVTCPNCPLGHEFVASLQSQYPDRVIAIGYYVIGPSQTLPVNEGGHKTKQDFRTQDATDIGNSVFGGVAPLPCAVIDRTKNSSAEYMIDRNGWSSAVTTRIGVVTPVNLKVTSSFTSGTRTAVIKVHAAFTQAFGKSVKMNIAILEDEIIDAQEYPNRIEPDYVHKHVLRDYVSTVAGDALLNDVTAIEKGRVYERTLSTTLPDNWDPKHCKIVVFLTSGEADDKEVLQAVEAELAP